MTNAQKNSPMLRAAGLWQKSSVKGGQYLTGRLGGVKVFVMENRDRQSDEDPSHTLFFVEAPDRRQGGQERSGGQRAAQTQPASPKPSQAQRSGFQGQERRMPDHQAPLDYDDTPEWAQ